MATIDQKMLRDLVERHYGMSVVAGSGDGQAAKSLRLDDTTLTKDLGSEPPTTRDGTRGLGSYGQLTTAELQVEQLVERAAQLLDRCLADRETYRKLRIDAFVNRLELAEFFDTDMIHQEEIVQGVHKQPYEETLAALNAEEQIWDARDKVGDHLSKLVNSYADDSATNARIQFAGYQGKLADNWPKEHAEHAFRWPATYSGASGEDGMREAGQKIALSEADYVYKIAQLQYKADLANFTRHSEANKKRLEGLREKKRYTELDIDYQRRRHLVTKNVKLAKQAQTVPQDGIMNYDSRADVIEKRFMHDYEYSYRLLSFIAEGISRLYFRSYETDDPLPTNGPERLRQTPVTALEAAAMGAVKTMAFLMKAA